MRKMYEHTEKLPMVMPSYHPRVVDAALGVCGAVFGGAVVDAFVSRRTQGGIGLSHQSFTSLLFVLLGALVGAGAVLAYRRWHVAHPMPDSDTGELIAVPLECDLAPLVPMAWYPPLVLETPPLMASRRKGRRHQLRWQRERLLRRSRAHGCSANSGVRRAFYRGRALPLPPTTE